MPRTLLVDAVGSCVAIDLTGLDEGDEAAVREAWADATVDAGASPTREPVDTVVPVRGSRAQMLSGLSQQVTLAAIEAARGRAWMLHAAGIATPDGAVVVLVGPSGRGKTTASRALGTVYGYVSDETVAIDDDGRVWPYRKPLSVIEDSGAPKTQIPPSALGLQPLPDVELHVAAVVLLDRDPGHPETPVIEVTDVGDALGDLVSQTSFLHDQPAALRFISALATATGGIRTVKYREAETLPPLIPELLRQAAMPRLFCPRFPSTRHRVPTSRARVPASRGSPWRTRWGSRTPTASRSSRSARTGRGHVTVLGGIAPAVWRTADGATLRQFVDAAIAAYDEPEGFDAAGAVLVAVGQLLDAGLLTSDEPVLARREDVASGRQRRPDRGAASEHRSRPAAGPAGCAERLGRAHLGVAG